MSILKILGRKKHIGQKTYLELWGKKDNEQLGDIYWLQGNVKKAIKTYRQTAKKIEGTTPEEGGNPSTEAFVKAAHMYEKSSQIQDAIRCYNKAKNSAYSGSKGYMQKEIDSGIVSLEKRLNWLEQVTQRPKDTLSSDPEFSKPIRVYYNL